MSLVSDTIPNLIQGISQQPNSLRSASQLEMQENCYSSTVEGLMQRPPIEHIAKVSDTPLESAFMHTINRDVDNRFKMVISDAAIRVFDLEGNEKTITYIDETVLLLDNAAAVINGAAFTTAPAPGETAVDFTVSGLGTGTVKLQKSADGTSGWADLDTRTTNGTTAGIALWASSTFLRVIVSAYTSGTIDASVTYKNLRYLVSDNSRDNMRAMTVADFTFIVNSKKTVRMHPELSPSRDAEVLTFVKLGTVNHTYQIWIDDVLEAQFTPGTAALATTQNIAAELYNDLVASAIPNFTHELIGNVIWSYNDTDDFIVRAADSGGGTELFCFKDATDQFSNLPIDAPDGFVLKIIPDPTSLEQKGYYVKAVTSQPTEVFGPATWEETLQDGIEFKFNEQTMPYALIHEEDDTFSFEAILWDDRIVGDDDTNPLPSFVDTTINDLYFYKNRLGWLADENFIMSQIGPGYFNFWRTTVTQVKDDDPIDSRASNTTVSILERAIPFDKSLVLFSDQTQFIIPGEAAMTPKTVRCDVISRYTSNIKVAPVNNGQALYFMFDRDTFAGMNELAISVNNPDKFDAEESTAHVPAYIPAGVFRLVTSPLTETSVILTDGDPGSAYVYKTVVVKDKRAQAAWFRWNVDNYTDSETIILDADFIDSTLYLLIQRDGEVFLEKLQLIPNRVDVFHGYLNHVDRRITDAELVSAVYDSMTNTTELELPYNVLSTMPLIVTRSVEDNDPFEDVGKVVPIVDFTEGSPIITVSGDWSTNPLWLGQRYLAEAELSTIYVRKQSLAGSVVIETNNRLQLMRGFLVYSDSGPFTVSVTPRGRATSAYIFTGNVIGADTLILGQVALHSGRFSFGIFSRNEQVRIVFSSNSFQPFHWTSMDWEGSYVKRARGR